MQHSASDVKYTPLKNRRNFLKRIRAPDALAKAKRVFPPYLRNVRCSEQRVLFSYSYEGFSMMKNLAGWCAACLCCVASLAHAEGGMTLQLGSSGIGVHAVVPVAEKVQARAGINALNYSYDGNTSDVSYNLNLKLKTIDFLADYYPSAGSFRLTAGLIYNGNKVDARGKPNNDGTYTLNGNVYSTGTVGVLDGHIDFRNLAPYIGLGWGNPLASDANWHFTGDLGLMLHGSARSSLASSGCQAVAAVCAALQSDIDAENQKLRDKVANYKLFPVVRVGMSYRF